MPALLYTGFVLITLGFIIGIRQQRSVSIAKSASNRDWVRQDPIGLSDDDARHRVGDLHGNASVSRFNSLTHRGGIHGAGDSWIGK
jgi:hypothetical protein